jgi:chloramphenicol 3-O-phosphotransferase
LLHAYHHAVAAAARSGLNVIVDDVVIDDGVLGEDVPPSVEVRRWLRLV